MKKFDIIWYLSGDWETDHRRQMITSFAKNMAPYGKILCVNRPISFLTDPFLKTGKFVKWIKRRSRLVRVTDNLYNYTPFVLIHDQIALKSRILTYLNRKILSSVLGGIINKIGFKDNFRLSWVYIPTQLSYLGLVGDHEYIYECFDKYSEFKFPLVNKSQIIQYDRKLTENALLVFNTARKLYDERIKINHRSYYTPNAVNIDLFIEAAKKNNGIPYDMKSLQRPIVGFIGNVGSNFVDMKLIKKLASDNPSFSFVFLGKIHGKNNMELLLNTRNVHYLGFKNYEDIPCYVLSFDVGIIPFKINEITESLNPLKVYEFMAASCPVVATDIPELRVFSGLISIARDYDEFDSCLKRVLSSDNSDLRKRLLNEAQKHSWDHRTKDMLLHVRKHIGGKA